MTGSRRLWSAAAILALCLVATGWFLRASALEDGSRAGAQADAVGVVLQRLLASLSAAETAVRGYAFTGKESEAKTVDASLTDADHTLDALSTLNSIVPADAPVEMLRLLVSDIGARCREAVRLRKTETADAALRRAISDEAEVLRGRLSQTATEIASAARRQADTRRATDGIYALVASGLAAVGALLGLAATFLGLRGTQSTGPARDPYRATMRDEGAGDPMVGAVFSALDDAVLAMDAHGKVFATNQAAEALLGLGETSPGSRAPALYAPDAGKKTPPAESPLLKALKGQPVRGATLSVGRPNEPGSRKVIVSAKPVLDGNGKTRGAVMVMRDVTEGKNSSGAIRKSDGTRVAEPVADPEEAVARVFENAPIAIVLAEADGRIARANAALCRLLGYTAEELLKRDLSTLVHADDVKKEAPLLRQLLAGQIPSYEIDKRLLVKGKDRKKDAQVTVRWSASAVRGTGRDVTGVLAFAEEVRERRRTERARESQDLLRLVLDTLPVGVWVTDAAGRVTLANPAGNKLWSKDAGVARFEEGEYKGFWSDSGKRIQPDEWGALRAIKSGEPQVDKSIQVQRFDGARQTLLTSAVPVRGADGAVNGAIVVQQEVPDPAARATGPDQEGMAQEIALLRAMVPLCSSCEKKRDDPAYWKQVRAYVHEHKADLRDATCTECSSRAYDLWGELVNEKSATEPPSGPSRL